MKDFRQTYVLKLLARICGWDGYLCGMAAMWLFFVYLFALLLSYFFLVNPQCAYVLVLINYRNFQRTQRSRILVITSFAILFFR